MVNCVVCGAAYVLSKFNPQRIYCSNACKLKAFKLNHYGPPRMRKCPAPPPLPRMAPCPKPPRACQCGAHVGDRRRVCEACAYAKLRAHKAKDKALRRARQSIEAETFSPLEVFIRDKWRCQLCGVATPERLRATYQPNAPELDHVISLRDGGPHTRANTQCACRRCNSEKGSRSLGQLGLHWGET